LAFYIVLTINVRNIIVVIFYYVFYYYIFKLFFMF